jgi:hypothetical protein
MRPLRKKPKVVDGLLKKSGDLANSATLCSQFNSVQVNITIRNEIYQTITSPLMFTFNLFVVSTPKSSDFNPIQKKFQCSAKEFCHFVACRTE